MPASTSSGRAEASRTSTTLFSFSVAVPCIRYPDVISTDIRNSTMNATGRTMRTMVAVAPASTTSPVRVMAKRCIPPTGLSTRAATLPSTRPTSMCSRTRSDSASRDSDIDRRLDSGVK